MILNPIDKSNYLRGLLLLIKRNRNINEIEKKRIKEVSNVLGFNGHFVDNAINELLENEFIIETPPIFTNHRLAETFIKDAIKITLVQDVLNIHKIQWLMSFAVDNDLSKQWLFWELEYYFKNARTNINNSFEIQHYLNEEVAVDRIYGIPFSESI